MVAKEACRKEPGTTVSSKANSDQPAAALRPVNPADTHLWWPAPAAESVLRRMTNGLRQEDRQFFIDQGYLVVRGLLGVAYDIAPFQDGFGRLLDGMAAIVVGEATRPADDCPAPSIASRLAVLIGSGGRQVMDHLEPALTSSLTDWQWRPDFPSAQFPELFWLMRNQRLLDAVESLLGPEIVCSPDYHINMKLGSRDRDLGASLAANRGETIEGNELSRFLVAGASEWHADGVYALPGSHRITAWIAITKATSETGCLRVVPGSHKQGPWWHGPFEQSLIDRAVDLPANPGDVVLFDNWMLHGAGRNRTENQFRWAVNFRYLRSAEPVDFVHLPSFVARSREAPERELRDPELWSQMWRHALSHAAAKRLRSGGRRPTPSRRRRAINRAFADALREHWRAKIRQHADWLSLGGVEQEPQPIASVSPTQTRQLGRRR